MTKVQNHGLKTKIKGEIYIFYLYKYLIKRK